MQVNERPRIVPEKQYIDFLFEVVVALLVVGQWIFVGLNFAELPDTMPRHFGANGEPDGYGSRSLVWFVPAISTVLTLGLFLLSRVPHVFNYLVEITPENALIQYRLAQRMIRQLNVLVAIVFSYVTVSTILTGLGIWNGVGVWFLPATIIFIFVALIGYLIQSSKFA